MVDGQIVGSMEIGVEPYRDGTIVHHYVRGLRDAAAPRDVGLRHVLRWKAAVVRLKDTLDGGVVAFGPWPSGPSPASSSTPRPGR